MKILKAFSPILPDGRTDRVVERIRTRYNATSLQYSKRETQAFWMTPIVTGLLPAIKNSKATALLDIGCGSGGLIEVLTHELPEIEYCGIDLSEELIKIARSRKLPAGSGFHVADLHKITDPFELFSRSHHRIFVASIGALEYYGATDLFASKLMEIRKREETVGMALTFHFAGSVLRKVTPASPDSEKKFWSLPQIKSFIRPGERHQMKFMNSLPLDLIACRLKFNGMIMAALDSVLSRMLSRFGPGWLFGNAGLFTYRTT